MNSALRPKGSSAVWILFSFILSNTLISFIEMPPGYKILVGIVGIALPLYFWSFRSTSKLDPIYRSNEKGTAAQWLPLSLILLAALLIRFSGLTWFSLWPTKDDGWVASYSMDLLKNWDWSLFIGYVNFPALYFWIQALIFKILGPSFLSLLFFPAVLSWLTVLLAYATARQFFDRNFSLLCGLITALSFWPSYTGRFPCLHNVVPPLELLSIYLWAKLSKTGSLFFKKLLILALGLVLSLGFYLSAFSWAAYWAFFHLWLLLRRDIPPAERKYGLQVILAEFIFLSPLVYALCKEGTFGYLSSLSFIHSQDSWEGGTFNIFSYPASILWGQKDGLVYRPQWGGILDPIAGGFFLLGLGCLLQNIKRAGWFWLLLALPWLLMPGLLSRTYEFYRIVALLPWLVLITALGFHALWQSRLLDRKILLLLLGASFLLDSYHSFGIYREFWATPTPQWRPFKSIERYRAYEILDPLAKKIGPGCVMDDFIIENFDRTLDLAVYSFDRSQNDSLRDVQIHWIAVIFPEHLRPFLQARFKKALFYSLSADLPFSYQNKCLAVIPAGSIDSITFENWRKANEAFRGMAKQLRYSKQQMTYGELQTDLLSIQPLFRGDPFLESCFDQKILSAFNILVEPRKALYFIQRNQAHGYSSPFFVDQKKIVLGKKHVL